MARQVLPVAGAVIGGAIGGPMGAQIGFALGSIVGNAVDPQVIKGPTLGEASLQTSAEGVFRPIVYGTAAVKGNVIERGNRQVKTQRTQQGKGGGPVTEEQRVYWTFAIRIAEGPITGVSRIWQDEKLVYDMTPSSTIIQESAQYADRFRLYVGDESQLPDPGLEAFKGIGNVNAYRGTAYIVFPDFDLTDRRESIPDFRFEISTSTPPVIVGRWIYGPVAENGIDGGSQHFYRTTDDPSDFYSGPLMPLPVWFGSMLRVSVANGLVFLHASVSSDAAVSFDRGVTFQQCSGGISEEENVFFDGSSYYCGGKKSPDGITWSTIPNLHPNTRLGTCAKTGLLAVAHLGGLVRTSTNGGTTWTDHPVISGFNFNGPIATDDVEFHFTLNSNIGYYSTDNFGTFINSIAEGGGALLHPIWGGGANWMRKSFFGSSGQLQFSQDGGDTYEIVLTVTSTFGANSDASVAYGDGVWVAGEFQTGPAGSRIHYSSNGTSWTLGDRLYGNDINIAFIGGGTGGGGEAIPVTLASIVADLHSRVRQDSSYYNVSELTNEVYGLVLAGDYTVADAIRTLMPVYSFDAAEYDDGFGYKLHYPKRGKPVVLTVTVDDLIDAPEKTVREDALERPKALHLHYENPTIGYAPAKATSRRSSPDVLVVGEQSVQVPVSFVDVDEPAQISDKLLRLAWVTVGGETEMTVGDHLLELVPSDSIGVSLRGQVTRQLITQDSIEPGGLTWKLLADRQSAYTSNVTGVPVPVPTPPLPSIVGQTVFNFLDIPALTDNDDRLLWYEAASGQTSAWYGAQTQRKAGAAIEFENSARFTQNTIMGTLVDPINAASEYFTDTTNVVRVQLYSDDVIESLTDQQFLSEGGAFALANADGTWEVLQYRDADDEGDGVFALSYLARGRLNTGGSQHLIGSRFVLLDGGTQAVDAVTAWIDTDIVSRAISSGMSADGAPQFTNEYTAKSQTEFPVANILLDLDGTSLGVRVVPRHRFGTEVNPVVSSNWVGYRITATDGVNSTTVETLSATTTFDVTGWGPSITVSVAQRNRFTGEGPEVSETL